jgi:phage/conjugal plasmid C-4 type zinc finger TraR family protein
VDIIDLAQDYIERDLANKLASRPRRSTTESAIVCEDCGEPIPEARRKAVPGCKRCVECQQEYERS